MQWFRRSEHAREGDLSALLDGALSPREQARLEGHVASCAVCRSRLEELREVKTLVASLPQVQPSRSFVLSPEMARVPEAGQTAPARSRFVLAPAAAFAVFLALVAVDLMGTTGTSQDEAAVATFDQAEAATLMAAPNLAEEAGGSVAADAGAAAPNVGEAGAGGASSSSQALPAPEGTPVPAQAPFTAPLEDDATRNAAGADGDEAAGFGPLSIEAAPGNTPAPLADFASEGDDGLNWLRVGQVAAALALLGSLALVFVPRLIGKGS